MMENKISHERFISLVYYDEEQGHFYSKATKRRLDKIGPAGGYYSFCILGFNATVHRWAIFYKTGKWPRHVDHIDRNKHNNKWSNLRECTHAENMANNTDRKLREQPNKISVRNNTGIRGVTKRKGRTGDWYLAQYRKNGKQILYKSFLSFEEAKQARLEAEKQYGIN